MKIGLVIYGSLDTLSGGYMYDRKLVDYLRSQGDEVQIISQPWGGYLERLGLNMQAEWRQKMAALDVDVLLQDELNHPSLYQVNQELKPQLSYPILAITHHLRSSEKHPRPLLWLYRKVEKRYLQSVDGFIWNSRTTRQVVEKVIGKAAPGVVAYPAGDRLGGTDESAIIARSQLDGPLRLLFVGSIIPRKGLQTLIKALGSLNSQDWVLNVVGRTDVDPAYYRRILQQAQVSGLGGRIQFPGNVDEEALTREFQEAQLMVMVSEYEGFGIVYLEGMSFGLPAIGSTAGATGEIIQDGVNGRLVAPGNAAALAKAIRPYLTDRTLLQQHSLAAKRHFHEFPTWEESTASIRRFLVDFLEKWNESKS